MLIEIILKLLLRRIFVLGKSQTSPPPARYAQWRSTMATPNFFWYPPRSCEITRWAISPHPKYSLLYDSYPQEEKNPPSALRLHPLCVMSPTAPDLFRSDVSDLCSTI